MCHSLVLSALLILNWRKCESITRGAVFNTVTWLIKGVDIPNGSKRFCRLVSGLCRHMSVQAVSRHLNIRWGAVKNMDKCTSVPTFKG